jgi:hypothetical protein
MADEPAAEPKDDPTPEPTPAGNETVTMTKAEADALRRELAEARRNQRKAETAAEKAAREKAEKDGDFKKVADEADRKRQEAEQRYEQLERKLRVQAAASRHSARSADDLQAFLTDNELKDDSSVDAGIKRLKREKPYLFAAGGRSGGAIDADPTAKPAGSFDSLVRRRAGRA